MLELVALQLVPSLSRSRDPEASVPTWKVVPVDLVFRILESIVPVAD